MAKLYRVTVYCKNGTQKDNVGDDFEEYIVRLTTGQLNALHRLLGDIPEEEVERFTIGLFQASGFEGLLREIEVSLLDHSFPARSAHEKAEELRDEPQTPRNQPRRKNPQG